MAKWPDVPAVYGWLALDRRGHWLLRGERIANDAVNAFISRNFAHDEAGRWYFQNGPQRVFVRIEYAPLVLRVVEERDGALGFETHTGRHVASLEGAWLDETGSLVVVTDLGPGVVDDRDLDRLMPAFVDVNGNAIAEDVLEELIELAGGQGDVPLWLKFAERNVRIGVIRANEIPSRFAFVRDPEAPATADRAVTE